MGREWRSSPLAPSQSCACVFPSLQYVRKALSDPLSFFPSSPSSFRVSILAQAGLELERILQPQPSKSWDCRCEPPCPAPGIFLCVHLSCGGTCPWLREQVREPVTCLGKQLFLTFCRTLSCLVNLVSSSVKWDNKQVAYSYGGSSCHRVSAQC